MWYIKYFKKFLVEEELLGSLFFILIAIKIGESNRG